MVVKLHKSPTDPTSYNQPSLLTLMLKILKDFLPELRLQKSNARTSIWVQGKAFHNGAKECGCECGDDQWMIPTSSGAVIFFTYLYQVDCKIVINKKNYDLVTTTKITNDLVYQMFVLYLFYTINFCIKLQHCDYLKHSEQKKIWGGNSYLSKYSYVFIKTFKTPQITRNKTNTGSINKSDRN